MARSYAATGHVRFRRHYDEIVAIRDGKLGLEQTLPVSKRAWDERKGGASVMFIDTTMTPKVSELLRGFIVQGPLDCQIGFLLKVLNTHIRPA